MVSKGGSRWLQARREGVVPHTPSSTQGASFSLDIEGLFQKRTELFLTSWFLDSELGTEEQGNPKIQTAIAPTTGLV